MKSHRNSYLERWLNDFRRNSLEALDALLIGGVYLGAWNRSETDEIIYRIFHAEKELRLILDQAMWQWFDANLEKSHPGFPSVRWNHILVNALSASGRLVLPDTGEWLLNWHQKMRRWLRGLYVSPARDPEAALLRALAGTQKDQTLQPLWMRLCRLEENLPLHYASVGIIGLRILPEKDGSPPGELKPFIFRGLVDLANAADKRVKNKEEGKTFWFREFRMIKSLYPRTDSFWVRSFYPLLRQKRDCVAAKWLETLLPGLRKRLRSGRPYDQSAVVRPTSLKEVEAIFNRLKKEPFAQVEKDLADFLERQRNYANQTGDAEYLVKSLNHAGNTIKSSDAQLAKELVQEAMLWAPYDPRNWTQLALIEVRSDNLSEAEALLWEAKRKFPENDVIRNNLADICKKRGKYEIAELLYRQTMENFPKDEVCRNALAQTLMKQDRLVEAEILLRETMENFPNNVVCRTTLAVVLLKQPAKNKDGMELLEETARKFSNPIASGLLRRIREGEEARNFETSEIDFLSFDQETAEDWPIEDKDAGSAPVKKHLVGSPRTENKEGSFAPIKEHLAETADKINREEEAKLSQAQLYRWASHLEEDKKQVRSQHARQICEEVLQENQNSNGGLLEKGWQLLDNEDKNAVSFFDKQVERAPHIPGFKIGRQQARERYEPRNGEAWKSLEEEFDTQSLAVRLARSLSSLKYSDDRSLTSLNDLKKGLNVHPDRLPGSMKENFEWLRDSVSLLLPSFEEHGFHLQNIMEQCLSRDC